MIDQENGLTIIISVVTNIKMYGVIWPTAHTYTVRVKNYEHYSLFIVFRYETIIVVSFKVTSPVLRQLCDLPECQQRNLEYQGKSIAIMKLSLCRQRIKIMTVPLYILSSVCKRAFVFS